VLKIDTSGTNNDKKLEGKDTMSSTKTNETIIKPLKMAIFPIWQVGKAINSIFTFRS